MPDDNMPVIFPCGCSHNKVKLDRCDIFGPDGKLRVEVEKEAVPVPKDEKTDGSE